MRPDTYQICMYLYNIGCMGKKDLEDTQEMLPIDLAVIDEGESPTSSGWPVVPLAGSPAHVWDLLGLDYYESIDPSVGDTTVHPQPEWAEPLTNDTDLIHFSVEEVENLVNTRTELYPNLLEIIAQPSADQTEIYRSGYKEAATSLKELVELFVNLELMSEADKTTVLGRDYWMHEINYSPQAFRRNLTNDGRLTSAEFRQLTNALVAVHMTLSQAVIRRIPVRPPLAY